MKIVDIDEEAEALAFARKAAEAMVAEPGMWTYTDGDIAPGAIFASRWGMGEDCVAVFRLDHNFEPRIYPQFIPRTTTPKGAP